MCVCVCVCKMKQHIYQYLISLYNSLYNSRQEVSGMPGTKWPILPGVGWFSSSLTLPYYLRCYMFVLSNNSNKQKHVLTSMFHN